MTLTAFRWAKVRTSHFKICFYFHLAPSWIKQTLTITSTNALLSANYALVVARTIPLALLTEIFFLVKAMGFCFICMSRSAQPPCQGQASVVTKAYLLLQESQGNTCFDGSAARYRFSWQLCNNRCLRSLEAGLIFLVCYQTKMAKSELASTWWTT